MKILYFDCPSGASGNMILASLIEAGLPINTLIKELNQLNLNNYQIKTTLVNKNSISATYLEVIETFNKSNGHRNLAEIFRIINESNLNPHIKETSCNIFNKLAAAEASIHNKDINTIHFHEVGAIDAIIDIVGASIAIDYFQPDRIICSPIPLGNGYIKCQHGILPVPAPATLQLIRNIPIKETTFEGELLTPTGAAIITTITNDYGPLPTMKIDDIGQGAGLYDLPIPNILRAIIGRCDNPSLGQEISIIESNIDDMNPEFYPYIIEKLLLYGAHDVCIIPNIMKKGRPGHILQVISPPNIVSELTKIILSESTSLGLRIRTENRIILNRQSKSISTSLGTARVKIGQMGDKILNISPEYEDCKAIAKEQNMPIKMVYELILFEAKKLLRK